MSSRRLIVVVFLLPAIVLMAQDGAEVVAYERPVNRLNLSDYFVAVHVEPFSVFRDDGFMRLGATVQRKSTSFLLDLAFGEGGFGGTTDFEEELAAGYRYRGFRSEIRLHWPQYWGTYYVGIEYGYGDIGRELQESSYYDPSLSPAADIFAFESGQRRSIRHSMIFKFGHATPLFRKFYLDLFVGMGHSWQTIDFRNLRNVRVDLTAQNGRRALNERGFSRRFRRGFAGNFTFELGARFGIRFEKAPDPLLDE